VTSAGSAASYWWPHAAAADKPAVVVVSRPGSQILAKQVGQDQFRRAEPVALDYLRRGDLRAAKLAHGGHVGRRHCDTRVEQGAIHVPDQLHAWCLTGNGVAATAAAVTADWPGPAA
jgi:hypothetical protein